MSAWWAIGAIAVLAAAFAVVAFLGYRDRVRWDREYDEKHRDDGWHI